jgi:hypothetical protein
MGMAAKTQRDSRGVGVNSNTELSVVKEKVILQNLTPQRSSDNRVNA